jgi:two-component system response regulator AtoC
MASGLDHSAHVAAMPPIAVVFGRSEAMRHLRMNFDRLASANVPVLIQGESGTGKDVIARLIHSGSPWADGPFVKVNCPAIPHNLIESELFGYEPGAFTGANGSKPGRVELAHHGTLFLDEISELDIAVQSKLLQFLQDGQFTRIGGQEDRRVDVRLVCASNRRLEDEVTKGTFRQDLFYRINALVVQVPPLRQRTCDIPVLAEYFLQLFNDRYNSRSAPFSERLLSALAAHSWPGNIRELENLVRRYVILGSEDAVFGELTPRNFNHRPSPEIPLDKPFSLKEITRAAVRDVERTVILKILEANQWNRRRTARALKISYRALLYKLKEAGVAAPENHTHEPLND